MEILKDVAAAARRIEIVAAGPKVEAPIFEGFVEAARGPLDSGVRVGRSVPRSAVERYVAAGAAAYGVDPALVEAVIASESGFDSNAVSRAGAVGLMQLMPQTAARLGVRDPYDPAQNVAGGARYLRELLDRFGDVELAVAAYNAGPAAVERYRGVPPYPQTQRYVRDVIARYRELRVASSMR